MLSLEVGGKLFATNSKDARALRHHSGLDLSKKAVRPTLSRRCWDSTVRAMSRLAPRKRSQREVSRIQRREPAPPRHSKEKLEARTTSRSGQESPPPARQEIHREPGCRCGDIYGAQNSCLRRGTSHRPRESRQEKPI